MDLRIINGSELYSSGSTPNMKVSSAIVKAILSESVHHTYTFRGDVVKEKEEEEEVIKIICSRTPVYYGMNEIDDNIFICTGLINDYNTVFKHGEDVCIRYRFHQPDSSHSPTGAAATETEAAGVIQEQDSNSSDGFIIV
jgi:hypothetical protein